MLVTHLARQRHFVALAQLALGAAAALLYEAGSGTDSCQTRPNNLKVCKAQGKIPRTWERIGSSHHQTASLDMHAEFLTARDELELGFESVRMALRQLRE